MSKSALLFIRLPIHKKFKDGEPQKKGFLLIILIIVIPILILEVQQFFITPVEFGSESIKSIIDTLDYAVIVSAYVSIFQMPYMGS